MRGLEVPWVTKVSYKKDPYRVLISCILSLRTKDETTASAGRRLFKAAHAPRTMLRLTAQRIQRLIYPVGFYRNKSRSIREISRRIIADFSGKVPHTFEELLSLPGVGPKTANLVLGLGFGIPAICVDTHVHRISNRLGWVRTKTPGETEYALRKLIPERYWIRLNTFLVAFGQRVCVPVSPYCSRCSVYASCKRSGVGRRR